MAKASYIDVETPKELQEKALQAIEMAKDSGRIRKGMNEATKAIERGSAELIVIAGDVDPPEVVVHLPMLCKEKKIGYVFIDTKVDLGKSAGIGVGCSAIAIEKSGNAKEIVGEILSKLGVAARPASGPSGGRKSARMEGKERKPEKAEGAGKASKPAAPESTDD